MRTRKSTLKTTKIFHFASEVGSTPVDYSVFLFDDLIEKEIKKILAKTSLDILNGSFYDCQINIYLEEAMNDLNQQRLNHYRTIIGLIEEKKAKISCYQKEIEDILDMIEKNRQEVNMYEMQFTNEN